MAIEVSSAAVKRGSREEVKDLAARIIEEQSAELSILEAALSELEDVEPPPPMPAETHNEADMDVIGSISGDELDMRFLIE